VEGKFFVPVFFGCGQPPLIEHVRILGIGLELAWKGGLCGGNIIKKG